MIKSDPSIAPGTVASDVIELQETESGDEDFHIFFQVLFIFDIVSKTEIKLHPCRNPFNLPRVGHTGTAVDCIFCLDFSQVGIRIQLAEFLHAFIFDKSIGKLETGRNGFFVIFRGSQSEEAAHHFFISIRFRKDVG